VNRRALFVIAAAAALLAGAAWSQPAPPRSINDIAALLDQHKPDPARLDALKATAGLQPPAGADKSALLSFYLKRAEALQGLGMVGRQLADLRSAAELARGTDAEWSVMIDIFLAEVQVGNFAAALKLKEQTDALVGKFRGRRIIDGQHMVFMYTTIGDVASARRAYKSQQAVLASLKNTPFWAQLGDAWTAHSEAARALILNAEGKHSEAAAVQRNAVAAVKRHFESSIGDPAAQSERLHHFVWIMQLRLVRILVLQGRLAEAELEVRDVLRSQVSRVGRFAPNTALTLNDLSWILIEQGRFNEAERAARAALDIHKAIGTVPSALPLVIAGRALATALVMQARWHEGLAVFEEARAGLAKDPDSLKQLGRGDVNWALALIKSARAAEAVSMLEPLVKSSREQLGEAHYLVGELRGFLAMALAETGQPRRALDEYQEAVNVLLARGRADADEEEARPARAKRLVIILEGYIRLLDQARNEVRAGFDAAAEAFRVADATRGRATQQALAASAARASTSDPALGELVRREQDEKQQIAVLYTTLLRLLNAPAEQQLPQVVAQIRARIQEIEKERRRLLAELDKRFPAYVNLISPKPATVDEARAALREGEALVSVLATEERTYVWVVPKQGAVGFHASGMGERAVNRIVGQLRRALDPGGVPLERFPEYDVATAHRLYSDLLKPVEGAWKGAHTLMVVANGALSQLPIAVLPTEPAGLAADSGLKFERYRSVPWLVKQVAVTQLPAVSTLVTLRALPQGNSARGPFIGFGDPHFGGASPPAAPQAVALRMRSAALSRELESRGPADWAPYSQLAPLPDTREEILSIAQALKADPRKDVFLGAQASKDNVKQSDLRNRRIVAFATHGLIPGDFPNLEEPALALAAPDGNAEAGLLTLGDILGLKMDADWVVLSACNTAAGDGAGADAISGLGRGFFYAGSRALLVTHWPVETRSARLLVTQTFERYANSPATSRAEALRQASLAVMQASAENGGKALFSYAHPVFWAPYALVGDGGR
jgi:CHAT domain-containing protein